MQGKRRYVKFAEIKFYNFLFFNFEYFGFQMRWLRIFSGQEHTAPIFKCFPSRKLSCSLLLDLLPGCLFINSIGCDINVIDPTRNESCCIESNNIAVPFELLVILKLKPKLKGVAEFAYSVGCLLYIKHFYNQLHLIK